MAQLRNVSIIVVVIAVAAAMFLHSTEAEEYTVGGNIGWTSFPPGGAPFYSKWASNFTFKVNDILVFNFESGSHTVAKITKGKYEKCNVSENTPALATGPARVTLYHTGTFYFACTFTGHCSSGQKLMVNVTNSSSSSSSSPAPTKAPPAAEGPSSPLPSGSVPTIPPSSSSTVPGAISPPPPKGSATTLPAASFSLLLFIVAFNFLFQF